MKHNIHYLSLRLLPSLAKIFPTELPVRGAELMPLSGLRDECVSFQVASQSTHPHRRFFKVTPKLERLVAESHEWEAIDAGDALTFYEIKNTPGEFVAQPLPLRDNSYLKTEPGLYPDLLEPIDLNEEAILQVPGQWHGLWCEFNAHGQVEPGSYRVTLSYSDAEGGEDELLGDTEISRKIEIIDASLAPETVWHTEWFHADCVADFYGDAVWSEEHWQALEGQMRMATSHGINLLLTPLFTPPLDTYEGGERTTVQLLDIEETGEREWRFDFNRFRRWVRLAQDCGYKGFEICHLFTQWGAKSAPKIMVMKDGQLVRRFFWDVKASSDEYRAFLRQLLEALFPVLDELGIRDVTFFHISDEPNFDHLDSYREALSVVEDLLRDEYVIDALSDFSFYREGLVKHPIPANDHIEPFLEAEVPDLWTYYCTGQSNSVSNRFFGHAPARARVLGTQLFKFNIKGFLHWGYNFYNSQYSLKPIDPFRNADANGGFHAGDPYLVYPGKDRVCLPSLRLKWMREAFQDLRALECLAELTSREFVLELIDGKLEEGLSFTRFPDTSDYILGLRLEVNEAIKEAIASRA